MKKIIATLILSSLILSTKINAQESLEQKIHIGVDAIASLNKTTVNDGEESYNLDNTTNLNYKIKLGWQIYPNWTSQLYYSQETYENPIFTGKSDQRVTVYGFDIIRTFPTNLNVTPFIQYGVSLDTIDVEEGLAEITEDDLIQSVAAKIGGGIRLRISHSIDLLAGLDLQLKAWPDISDGPNEDDILEIREISGKLYTGINYYF